jgi:hypothetical protein
MPLAAVACSAGSRRRRYFRSNGSRNRRSNADKACVNWYELRAGAGASGPLKRHGRACPGHPRFCRAELKNGRYHAPLTTVPGQDQLLACESLGPGRGDYPIDAQPHGSNGFGRATVRNDREDFRLSSIGRTRSGLREVAAPSRTSFSNRRT